MPIEFYKYQGTGNDFIIINNFSGKFDKNNYALIQRMCDRKYGIGSDGLMLLEKCSTADFQLIFFNPDASLSFCGNGSRCAVRFARDQKIVDSDTVSLLAFDGKHDAKISNEFVSVSMRDIDGFRIDESGVFVNTGAPHVVVEVNDLEKMDIIEEGRKIRYHSLYSPVGTNVNFIQPEKDSIRLRTYEKGVENETLSCGTGVTAAALVFAYKNSSVAGVNVKARGGDLKVEFNRVGKGFNQVRLIGPAKLVFKGEYYE